MVYLRYVLLVCAVVLVGCSKPVERNPLIGLLSDYGLKDAYVGELKGAIYTIHHPARLVDLTHEVEAFNTVQGAYLLAQMAREFPAGSIFVAVVDPGFASKRPPILVKTRAEKYYLAPDNGLLTYVIQREELGQAWSLDNPRFYRGNNAETSFYGRDILGPIAAHLAAGQKPAVMGTPTKNIQSISLKPARSVGKMVSGNVIYMNRYGNMVTNIPRQLSEQLKAGKVYRVTVGRQTLAAPLVQSYSDVAEGRFALIYNSGDLLELAVNKGSAARLLKLDLAQPLEITLQP
jgi:S-adenosyl-L-methionine hydrolase (adenosine-forming)